MLSYRYYHTHDIRDYNSSILNGPFLIVRTCINFILQTTTTVQRSTGLQYSRVVPGMMVVQQLYCLYIHNIIVPLGLIPTWYYHDNIGSVNRKRLHYVSPVLCYGYEFRATGNASSGRDMVYVSLTLGAFRPGPMCRCFSAVESQLFVELLTPSSIYNRSTYNCGNVAYTGLWPAALLVELGTLVLGVS